MPPEFTKLLEEFAEQHDVSRSKAGYFLMAEGVQARQRRHRLSVLDTKIDQLFEALSLDPPNESVYKDRGHLPRVETLSGNTIEPDIDLNESPHSLVQFPDADD